MEKRGMFDLAGRIALVTAGGHGLGRQYCDAMAEFGADIVCNDIDLGLAQETTKLIKRHGHESIAIQADVSKQDEIERMVRETVAKFGTIDILFCNAGTISPIVPLHELPVEEWDRVLNLNIRGTFLCVRTVLPVMLKQKRGSIIITSSVSGLRCGKEPHCAPYGTSKAAVIGFTRHVAVAYAKDGIRINAIAPGVHDTRPVGMGISVEKAVELQNTVLGAVPMGRMGTPSEIKGLAVYLASDASSYVTGQTFVEDGGATA